MTMNFSFFVLNLYEKHDGENVVDKGAELAQY